MDDSMAKIYIGEIYEKLMDVVDRLSRIEAALPPRPTSTVTFSFTGEDSSQRARVCADLVTRELGAALDRIDPTPDPQESDVEIKYGPWIRDIAASVERVKKEMH